MSEADKRIGQNVAHFRGAMSQAALATEMKARGWKWSQPTVAAIEKGERSLKLAEAEDIYKILNLGRVEDLYGYSAEAMTQALRRRLQMLTNALEITTRDFWATQLQIADLAESAPNPDEDLFRQWAYLIADDPVQIVSAAIPQGSMTKQAVEAFRAGEITSLWNLLARGPYGDAVLRGSKPYAARESANDAQAPNPAE